MTYEEKLREAAEEYFHYNPAMKNQASFEDALFHCQAILRIIADEDWVKCEMDKWMIS